MPIDRDVADRDVARKARQILDYEQNLTLLEICDAVWAEKHGAGTDATKTILAAACVASLMARRAEVAKAIIYPAAETLYDDPV